MIQRIQTIYFFISMCIALVLLFIPYAQIFVDHSGVYIMKAHGIKAENSAEMLALSYPLLVLISLTGVIMLVNIFLYKKRLLQLRLSVIALILNLGIYGLAYYYLYNVRNAFESTVHYSVSLILPLISSILIYLAIRAVKKDELLVKSFDRLR